MFTIWDLVDVFYIIGEISFLASFLIVSEDVLSKAFSDDVKESCLTVLILALSLGC